MNAIATTVQDHATDRCRFPIAAAAAELAKLGVQMHTGKRQLMGGLPKGSLFIEGHFVRFVDWLRYRMHLHALHSLWKTVFLTLGVHDLAHRRAAHQAALAGPVDSPVWRSRSWSATPCIARSIRPWASSGRICPCAAIRSSARRVMEWARPPTLLENM